MSRVSTSTHATLLALLILVACGKSPEPDPIGPRRVRTEMVYLEGAERIRTFSGVARAGIESQLSFKVAGTLEEVAVRVGDEVQRNALIASIDPTDYELKVEDARAALLRQQASERNARTTYRRTEALYENNNAALADLEAARAAYETAQAAVQSAQKALELAETQLSYTVLRAPIDGAISAVTVDEGENVQPGSPVAVLTAGERPEVQVSIPEMLIGGVAVGSSVTVHCDAVPGKDFPATVTEVGVAAMDGASAFPVKVRLDEETREVLPGMAAEVDFRFEPRDGREVVLVPPTAVAEDVDGRFAFVVEGIENEMGAARRRAVTVGDLTADGLEVLTGLEDGDVVVTAGVDRLVDGERVRLWKPTGASR